MKEVFDRYGTSFCSAPWTSVWAGAGGDIKFCCATSQILGNINDQSIESIIRSPGANETRLKFLNKQKPVECDACWQREAKGNIVGNPRYVCNSASTNSISKSLSMTNLDGSLKEHTLNFFDIIWTNKCNFACLHCTPSLSSTIASAHEDTFSIWLSGTEQVNFDKWTDPNKIDNSEKIDYILKNAHSIKTLHFNGGEPFLQEETFVLLDELKKLGLQGKIKLWFHTNGSIRTYKNVDIVEDYLKDWKNCTINMSHDHFGLRGEYFRYGYKDNKWLETYQRFKSANIPVNIDTSITLFNVLTLKELSIWYRDNNISDSSYLGWKYILTPKVWNVMNLTYTNELKEQLLESLNSCVDFIDKENNSIRTKAWANGIKGLILSLKDSTMNYTSVKYKFIRSITALDQKRGTDFLNTFPELTNFYKELSK